MLHTLQNTNCITQRATQKQGAFSSAQPSCPCSDFHQFLEHPSQRWGNLSVGISSCAGSVPQPQLGNLIPSEHQPKSCRDTLSPHLYFPTVQILFSLRNSHSFSRLNPSNTSDDFTRAELAPRGDDYRREALWLTSSHNSARLTPSTAAVHMKPFSSIRIGGTLPAFGKILEPRFTQARVNEGCEFKGL